MALFHWLTISNCVYDIYEEQDRVQYPKLLIAHTLHNYYFTFWLFMDNSFHHSLQVGMFCIIDSIPATGLVGYLEVDLGVIVGTYWIFASVVKVSCTCSLAID